MGFFAAVPLRAGQWDGNSNPDQLEGKKNPEQLNLKDYTKVQFDTKTFQTHPADGLSGEFKTKAFTGFDGVGGNPFSGTFETKNYTGTGTYQANSKSVFSENQRFDPGGREVKGAAFPVTAARESGQISSQFTLKPAQDSTKRYQGPELKVIGQEVKIINASLINKDDLKTHQLSEEEIKKILNKNK